MQVGFFLKIMIGLIITIPLHAHIFSYFLTLNAHNNKEIYFLAGLMACVT